MIAPTPLEEVMFEKAIDQLSHIYVIYIYIHVYIYTYIQNSVRQATVVATSCPLVHHKQVWALNELMYMYMYIYI